MMPSAEWHGFTTAGWTGGRVTSTDGAGNRISLAHFESGRETVTYYTYNAANELTQRQVGVNPEGADFTEYDYRCLCQVDLGERVDSALSSISLS